LVEVAICTLLVARQGLGVVEEVEAKVEERTRHGLAVDQHVALGQVPATRPAVVIDK
jgi:hypothetical protein